MRTARKAASSASVTSWPWPCNADGNAGLAPGGVRHAENGCFGNGRMREDLLLDLARIDVGAARDVHVGGAAGDVDEALLVHMAEVAGAKPAVAERFRIRFRVVEIAGEDGRPDDADLARLKRRKLAALVVLDLHLHPGALETAGADAGVGAVLQCVQGGRQNGDVAGDLAEAEVLY